MKNKMYLIYDKIGGIYSNPFVATNNAAAIRHFDYIITLNKETKPTDYELYGCGEYDALSGKGEFTKLDFIKGGDYIE